MTRSILPTVPLPPMDSNNRMRARQAAYRAKNLYPGVVGVTLSRELLDWEQFGWRLGNGGTILQLIEHCLTTPLPGRAEALHEVQCPVCKATIRARMADAPTP